VPEDGISSVRFMAICTAHFSREQWVAVRQAEFTAFIQVTLEATFWRLPRVDDRAGRSATLNVGAAWTVTGLATDLLRVCRRDAQARMGGIVKPARDSRVALRAFITADEFSSSDLRRRHHRAV
jgi:hypothetical protein